jgi:hypothetical protein
VTPWHDPVVEAVGHDLRSPYVERFWLALLGPSTCDVALNFRLDFHLVGTAGLDGRAQRPPLMPSRGPRPLRSPTGGASRR